MNRVLITINWLSNVTDCFISAIEWEGKSFTYGSRRDFNLDEVPLALLLPANEQSATIIVKLYLTDKQRLNGVSDWYIEFFYERKPDRTQDQLQVKLKPCMSNWYSFSGKRLAPFFKDENNVMVIDKRNDSITFIFNGEVLVAIEYDDFTGYPVCFINFQA